MPIDFDEWGNGWIWDKVDGLRDGILREEEEAKMIWFCVGICQNVGWVWPVEWMDDRAPKIFAKTTPSPPKLSRLWH